MAMTGRPSPRAPRRLMAAIVTAGLLVALGVVSFLVLRPVADDSVAADGPVTATTEPAAPSSAASPSVDPTLHPEAYPVLRVVDDDTVHVLVEGRDETVRLIGINAPETDQCWGSEATQAAARLLNGATVTLIADPSQNDRDRYGRLLRYVTLPDGTDIGLRMVQNGDADERTYDGPYALQQDYRAAAAAAAASGRGLTSAATCHGNQAPAGTESTGEPAATATRETGPNGCDIKGNISGNGRIYHLPGTADYGRTRIDESEGERWFCSVAEAEAAGWRARN